jgi:hypothetical protein
MLPEPTAAPDHVFPESGLAFMDTGRGTFSQRRTIKRGAYILLVHCMANLVQRREYCIRRAYRSPGELFSHPGWCGEKGVYPRSPPAPLEPLFAKMDCTNAAAA